MTKEQRRSRFYRQLAVKLKKARESKGLTQKEVADKAGTSSTYIATIEGGKKNISFGLFVDICHALKIDELEVLNQLNNKTQPTIMKQEIKEFCKKHNLTEDQFYGRDVVGEGLDLSGLTSIPQGFNPTVGGYLDLRNLTSEYTELNGKILSWQDGKYISADGVFSEVLSKKGNVYKLKKVSRDEISYLVTNGILHAHGQTLKDAKEGLKFKIISDKLKNEPINLDTIITIQHYRLITGACQFGVNQWLESNFKQEEIDKIESQGIKVREILPTLERSNAYGLQNFKKLIL